MFLRSVPAGLGNAAILADPNFAAGLTYDSAARAYAFAGGASFSVGSPTTIAAGAWRHVAQSYDGASRTSRLYIDGVPVASRADVPASIAINSLRMGRLGASASYLDGLVDEAFLFDDVLSDAQIAALAAPTAAPARFWISRSAMIPLADISPTSNSVEVDLLRGADVSQGEYATFYIWAQPARDQAGFYKQLQNFSLNIVASGTSGAVVDLLDTLRIVNPGLNSDGDPAPELHRVATTFDSQFVDPNNPNLALLTLSAEEIEQMGTPDGALGLAASNPAVYRPARGVGIGPWPAAGDESAVMTPDGPAWRVATFSVRSLTQEGQAEIYLQLGASGLNHAEERTADATVVFAAPGRSGAAFIYSAGPSGDRETTLPGDAPEIVLRVSDQLVGDYSADGRVDGADWLVWQRGFSSTTNLAADGDKNGLVDAADLSAWRRNLGRPIFELADVAHLSGDFTNDGVVDGADLLAWQRTLGTTNLAADDNGDGVVDTADFAIWTANFGQGVTEETIPLGALAVPEPWAMTLVLVGLATTRAATRRWRIAPHWSVGILIASAVLSASESHAAAINAQWQSAANGNWNDAANWSPAGVPNNGADTYEATIDASGGMYTVTLDANVTIDEFVLNSADATVNHTAGTFRVLGVADLLAGTYQLDGGTLAGGTWIQNGGALVFSPGRTHVLDGLLIEGDVTVNVVNSNFGTNLRLQNGARFTGNATISGFFSTGVLSVEHDLTFDDQTITVGGGGILGVSGTNTLTIGPNATIDMPSAFFSRISSDVVTAGTGTIVNQGLITVSGGGPATINPDIFQNQGTVLVTGGGRLDLPVTEAWSNTGVYRVDAGSQLILTGSVPTSALGDIDNTAGGTVGINGTLRNTGQTLTLDATTGDFTLNGGPSGVGTIVGGTVLQNDGARLLFAPGLTSVLNGTMVEGDVALAASTQGSGSSTYLRLQNGATFTGNAMLTGYFSAVGAISVEHPLTFDNQTITVSSVGLLGVSGDNTLTLGPNAQVNMSSQFSTRISSDLVTAGTGTIVNQGLITVSGGGAATINPDIFQNQGTVLVTGATSLSLGGVGRTFHNEGVLDIRAGTANVTGTFTHRQGAVLRGSGTFAGDFINEAAVRPGNSPGIITIDGDYTQTADGSLEIEIAGLTPGTRHDQLVVSGTATLGGLLEVPFIDGYVPTIGDEVTFVTAATRVGGFANVHYPTRLPAGVAQRVVYGPTDAKIEFVAPIPIDFVSPDGAAGFSNDNAWLEAGLPDAPTSENIISVANQTPTGIPQRVNVTAPALPTDINAAHSLLIGDASDPIALRLNDATLSITTDTIITANGALEQSDSSVLATQALDVRGGGRFEGGGRVIADVTVGDAGVGAATFAPGLNEPGTVVIDGAYSQGAAGVLEIEIASSPLAGQFDSVEADVANLGGTLSIDLSGLASPNAGDTYTIATAASIEGVFAGVEVVGNDDYYVTVDYGHGFAPIASTNVAAATAPADEVNVRLLGMGDANGDLQVDEEDARVFAAVLINNTIPGYILGPGRAATNNFKDAFDFYTEGAPIVVINGTPVQRRLIDFDDIQGFTERLAASQAISWNAAAWLFGSAYAAALAHSAPEPQSLVLLAMAVACRCPRDRRLFQSRTKLSLPARWELTP